jgi:hypothetical protein
MRVGRLARIVHRLVCRTPLACVFAAVSRTSLLNRPQVCLRGLARNPAPHSRRIGARHPALVSNAG